MFVVYTLFYGGGQRAEAEFNSREEAELWVKEHEWAQWDTGEDFDINEE